MNITKRLAKRIREQGYLFTESFDNLPGVLYTNGTDKFRFIDNGGDVLLVAHTDSVVVKPNLVVNDRYVACPTLDNRIGVYLVCHELPLRGIKADVLLTEGEEDCASTAAIFSTERKYNWIGEFDRMGYDCALYGYDDDDVRAMVRKHGYNPVHGSYTDICELEDLGIKGFNFGVAYNDYHSANSWIRMSDLANLIEMFVGFFHEYKNVHMPHVKKPVQKYATTSYRYSGTYGRSTSNKTRRGAYDYDDWESWVNRESAPKKNGTVVSKDDFCICDGCKQTFHLHDLDYDTDRGEILCETCYGKMYGYKNNRFDKYIQTAVTLCDDCSNPDTSVKSRKIYGSAVNLCDHCFNYYTDDDGKIKIARIELTPTEQAAAKLVTDYRNTRDGKTRRAVATKLNDVLKSMNAEDEDAFIAKMTKVGGVIENEVIE